MDNCIKCGASMNRGARFCAACGARLGDDAAGETVRKHVTVVYCDLADSTVLAERLDPEVLRRIV
ncbi:MAG TPA: zinc-ribbon domain-containing protein, partial [Pyrinomonadaceae bacterium]|nr:zinc-ribbon domain-containing protein [Pyrinomonadaceae bacterium]